ncbi:uncharacterized protein LOC134752988 [Cydia strobilella]|uniref:uncharacterized protein LOC134752988 n=1 Tax=Cydia strobilella TaxID=1100964 RepID=UPI003005E49C
MESSAQQGAESVCVKTEPCEDACITYEPTFNGVAVKAEPLLDDVCVNAKPCSNVCVKEESLGVSVAATASGLYTDHVVKDELVIGPVLVERRGRGVRRASTANPAIEVKQSCAFVPGRPLLKDCYVRLEPLVVDTLLTGTQITDRDSTRQVHEASVECERRNITVGIKGNNPGKGPVAKST